MFTLTAGDGILAAAVVSLFYHLYTRRNSLPPGPTGWPLIGNVLDMPKSHSWKTFALWGEIYGGIMSITLMGQPFVIVNDPVIATELLDKRGSLYADRPSFDMANMSGWGRVLSSARYGPQFKEYRKLIGKVIGTRGHMVKFYPVKDYQANMLLKRVLENPDKFDEVVIRLVDMVIRTAGAMVLHLTYGYKINEQGNDPLVDLADKALGEYSEITRPGAFLVDVMPIRFKKLANMYTKSCDDLAEIPLAYVRAKMENGQETESYASNLLLDEEVSADRLYQIKWSAASCDCKTHITSHQTVSVITAYFLAVAKYPEVQAKAQTEINAVVGPNRLPTFEDRDSLPYIEAICKELYRWLPIVPLAGDVYEKYFIPKGTPVIANVWKFLHDPEVYKDPFVFNPDRFLGPNPAPHPTDFGVFGFGRRAYHIYLYITGTHLADVSVWICVAKLVAGLTITRAIDAGGNEIDLVVDTTDGIISRPLPFTCTVAPRTAHTMQLVLDATVVTP
ncbi:cytochrome P450 [Mycena leptocephala]|nr:cytochrome P450 [Mycena leptocephala]